MHLGNKYCVAALIVAELVNCRARQLCDHRRCWLQIMRSVSTTEKVTGKNHYSLRVSHGTDYALMIAYCVIIDELFND